MSVIERNIEEMKEELKQRFVTTAQINYGRELSGLDEHEIYETLAQVVKQYTSENWIKTNKQSVEIYVNSGKGADVLKAMQTAFGITVSTEA